MVFKMTNYNSEDELICGNKECLKQFWDWFNGSKIVDEQGRPMVVYHGSLEDFNEFNTGVIDVSFSERFAEEYANNKAFEQGIDSEARVYAMYAKVLKPFDFRKSSDRLTLAKELRKYFYKDYLLSFYGSFMPLSYYISELTGKKYVRTLDNNINTFSSTKHRWENIRIGQYYDDINNEIDGTLADKKIIYKNDEFFIASELPEYSNKYEYYPFSVKEYHISEEDIKKQVLQVALKSKKGKDIVEINVPFTKTYPDNKDIPTESGIDKKKIRYYRIDNPKYAEKIDVDNWTILESASLYNPKTKERLDFDDVLKHMGYDGYYMREKGQINLAVYSSKQLKRIDNNTFNKSSSKIDESSKQIKEGHELFDDTNEYKKPEYVLNDNFKRWFGNSVLIDKEGNPLICYHGGYTDIKRFDKMYAGENTGNNEEKVFYFTPRKEVATDYSIESQVRRAEGEYYDIENPDKTYDEYEAEVRETASNNLHINPCFIRLENPFVYDCEGNKFDAKVFYTVLSTLQGTLDMGHYLFDDNTWEDIRQYFETYNEETDEYEYIENNYDGCIFTNVLDNISEYGGSAQVSDEYVIWNPKQIKSIYNRGLWSLESENIDESIKK